MECFPSLTVNSGALVIEYAPMKIHATLEPLSGMRYPILTGLSPAALYELYRAETAG
jgi:hypothetical protein